MKLLALFAVAGARMMPTATSDLHLEAHAQTQALWQEKGAFWRELATQEFTLLSTAAEQKACQLAIQNFNTTADTCMTPMNGLFESNSSLTSQDVHTKISNYCDAAAAGGSGCNQQMIDAVRKFKTDCIETGVFGEICTGHGSNQTACGQGPFCEFDSIDTSCHVSGKFFGNIRLILGVFCQQSDSTPPKYCVPSFWDFINTKPASVDQLTTQLTNGCDECTLKIFAFWSRVEPLKAAVNFLQVANLCLQRQDRMGVSKFCFVHQLQIDAARSASMPCEVNTAADACAAAARGCKWNTDRSKCDELWTNDKLDFTCHPCTLAYARRLLFLIDIMDNFQLPDPDGSRAKAKLDLSIAQYVVFGVCSTDLKDQYCMPQLQSQGEVNPASPCDGVKTALTNVGCCAPSFVDFMQGVCKIDTFLHPASTCQSDIDKFRSGLQSCSVTLGKTCAEEKFLLLHNAVLHGVDPAWLAIPGNKEKLIAELKRVVAFALGVDVSFIIELKIAAALATNGRRLLQTGDLQVTTTTGVPNNGVVIGGKTGLIGNMETLGVNDMVQTPGQLGGASMEGQSTVNIAVIGSSDASSIGCFVAVMSAFASMLLL